MSTRTLNEVEREDIRRRVTAGLAALADFEAGDYSAQLSVDLHNRHPLGAVFARINELIATFGAEHEQGQVFRLELETKLQMVEKQRAAIRELSTPII
jgi:rsbT co-antagonist protein RsbR